MATPFPSGARRVLALLSAVLPFAAPAMPGAGLPGGVMPPGPAAPTAEQLELSRAAEAAVYGALARRMGREVVASTPVAKVDGDAITADQVARAVGGAHAAGHGGAAGAKDFRPTVERLVDARLIVLEARESGMHELPAVKAALEKLEQTREREVVKARAVKDLALDKAKADRAYREATTEYRFHGLGFAKEADARQAAARMKQGKAFAAVAAEVVKAKQARDHGDGVVKAEQLLPKVRVAMAAARPGRLVGPVEASGTWLVALFGGVSQKDDAAAREQVETAQLASSREEALRAYYHTLSRKHAKVDGKLLAGLDYEAEKPGVAALRSDGRVLARVGDRKLTVAELTTELEGIFYHGVEDAAKKRKVNARKQDVFDSLLFKVLLADEAARQRVRESPEFQGPVRAAADRILFGTFLENAIAPSIKVEDAEVKAFYDAHAADYATPGMLKLEGLAFTSAKAAEAALKKLKAGTDYKWMKENADGLVAPDRQVLRFDGAPLLTSSLPEGMGRALAGAKEGDYRLYASPEGEAYVVHLLKEFPAGKKPLVEVEEGIRKQLFSEKVGAAIRSWADKLRPHHEIQVYVAAQGK